MIRELDLFSEAREQFTIADLNGLCEARGINYKAGWTRQDDSLVGYLDIDGRTCMVIYDGEECVAETCRMDGNSLPGGLKAFPLKGIIQSWLIGAELLRREAADTAHPITKGPTDLISEFDLYLKTRKAGIYRNWKPLALLGLDGVYAALLDGKHVRLMPDSDTADTRTTKYWARLLRSLGCQVDTMQSPEFHSNKSTSRPIDLLDALEGRAS
jgi:hypothetical protein